MPTDSTIWVQVAVGRTEESHMHLRLPGHLHRLRGVVTVKEINHRVVMTLPPIGPEGPRTTTETGELRPIGREPRP